MLSPNGSTSGTLDRAASRLLGRVNLKNEWKMSEPQLELLEGWDAVGLEAACVLVMLRTRENLSTHRRDIRRSKSQRCQAAVAASSAAQLGEANAAGSATGSRASSLIALGHLERRTSGQCVQAIRGPAKDPAVQPTAELARGRSR